MFARGVLPSSRSCTELFWGVGGGDLCSNFGARNCTELFWGMGGGDLCSKFGARSCTELFWGVGGGDLCSKFGARSCTELLSLICSFFQGNIFYQFLIVIRIKSFSLLSFEFEGKRKDTRLVIMRSFQYFCKHRRQL